MPSIHQRSTKESTKDPPASTREKAPIQGPEAEPQYNTGWTTSARLLNYCSTRGLTVGCCSPGEYSLQMVTLGDPLWGLGTRDLFNYVTILVFIRIIQDSRNVNTV